MSTPLTWSEVQDDGLDPARFTISAVRARLDRAEDPWAGFTRARHGLGRASERLAELARAG